MPGWVTIGECRVPWISLFQYIQTPTELNFHFWSAHHSEIYLYIHVCGVRIPMGFLVNTPECNLPLYSCLWCAQSEILYIGKEPSTVLPEGPPSVLLRSSLVNFDFWEGTLNCFARSASKCIAAKQPCEFFHTTSLFISKIYESLISFILLGFKSVNTRCVQTEIMPNIRNEHCWHYLGVYPCVGGGIMPR